MGKIKTLGFQIYSALQEINLQDAGKRTEVFNKINNTDFDYVGKREFKERGQSTEFIFSRRTSENTVEKSKIDIYFLYGCMILIGILITYIIFFHKKKI